MTKLAPKKRVSKAQWLERALEVLETEGLQGVRVERLARDLGIAKAGFYWHFRDRSDLRQTVRSPGGALYKICARGLYHQTNKVLTESELKMRLMVSVTAIWVMSKV